MVTSHIAGTGKAWKVAIVCISVGLRCTYRQAEVMARSVQTDDGVNFHAHVVSIWASVALERSRKDKNP
jgi:hypothetical protein